MSKKKTSGPTDIDGLLDLCLKDAANKCGVFTAHEACSSMRYVDFSDPVYHERGVLPFEWMFGTRGLPSGRVLKLDADPAKSKSTFTFLLLGMAQRAGAIANYGEAERTPAPPDFIFRCGADPRKLWTFEDLMGIPDWESKWINFITTVRIKADPKMQKVIVGALDSISGLAGDDTEDNIKDVEDPADKSQDVGKHSRKFSQFFREYCPLFAKQQAILIGVSQRKVKIGGGGGGFNGPPPPTSIAHQPWEFHSSHVLSFKNEKKKVDGVELEHVTVTCTKSKFCYKGRSVVMTFIPEAGDHSWELDDTSMLFLNSSFSPIELHRNNEGRYWHEQVLGGKKLYKADFLHEFYANADLLMQCREKLKIRGYGFDFETKYDAGAPDETDQGETDAPDETASPQGGPP